MSMKHFSSSLNSIAYVEFKKESIVKKIMRKNPKIKIQDKVLIMNFVGKANRPEGTETKGKNKAKGKQKLENIFSQKNETKIFFKYLILSSFS